MKLIPSNFKSEILELLNKGIKPLEIAKILKLNPISTNQMCNKLGFSFKLNQGNIRYFQNIDTNLKAYFLGFICADGAIVNNSLTITIHQTDKYLLEKLKLEIGCEHEIKTINTPMGFDKTRRVNHVRFVITNKDLIKDLNSYGIYPRKSMTIGSIIENIPIEFRNSFIIGYFDGDGCVVLPKGNTKFSKRRNSFITHPSYSIHVSFRGTEEFLNGIANHLRLDKNTIQFHKTHILSITNKKDIIKFFKCYNNLDFYLNRKYDKFFPRINHESYKILI